MLTVFSIPKPFRGHIGIIQRNALRSWTLLRPSCQIILFGNDQGCASAAAEFGALYVPDVDRNEYGTPLVSDIFAKADQCAVHNVLCYINADIIVMNDLLEAVSRIRTRRFLIIGRRHDLDITRLWDFDDPAWEAKLRTALSTSGSLHAHTGVWSLASTRITSAPMSRWGCSHPTLHRRLTRAPKQNAISDSLVVDAMSLRFGIRLGY